MWSLAGRVRAVLNERIGANWRKFLNARHPLIWALALVIGVAGAYATIAFRVAIGAVQALWVGTMSERLPSAIEALPWWQVLLGPIVAGAVVGLILRVLMPAGRPLGVADVVEAAALQGGRMPLKEGLLSAGLTAVSLGGGASAGREGPAVHLGATLAAFVADRMQLQPAASRTLLGCGAAAAVAASFNAPIAGVLFAHEVILGHYALRAFVPISIASVVAAIITRVHLGEFPAFIVPAYEIVSYWEFPAFALLGFAAAVVASVFLLSVMSAEEAARRTPLPVWLRPMLGGVVLGGVGLLLPEVLGVGYEATDRALKGDYGFWFLMALLGAKIFATALTLASRFGGGVFSPSLYLGAMTGGAFGILAAAIFPALSSDTGLYAIIGMGAVSAAVLGAPISTTLIAFELIGDYQVAIALLLAASISTALTQAFVGRSFFEWQLEGRQIFVHEGPHRRVLQTIRVRDVMTYYDSEGDRPLPDDWPAEAPKLVPSDALGKALGLMDSRAVDRYLVVNPDDPDMVIGEVRHHHALKTYNEALVAASREEHR